MSEELGSTNYLNMFNQNLNNSGFDNNRALQSILTDADANRQGYGDMLAQSGMLGGGYGSSGQYQGALPPQVNYPTLSQPVHQGNFTGSMIGSVPIYAAPGMVAPIGIEQARKNKLLKRQLGTMKGTPDYEPMKVARGYQTRFNQKYFDKYNSWIEKAQQQEPMLWRQLMTDSTPFGREFKQWRLDTEDLGRSLNSMVKVGEHVLKQDTAPGVYVSPKQKEIAQKIVQATDPQFMDELFENPKYALGLIKELQLHSDLATVLKHELGAMNLDIMSRIDAGSVIDKKGLGTVYDENIKTIVEPHMDDIVARIYESHPYIKDMEAYDEPEEMKTQVRLYFGDKMKQHIFREHSDGSGRIKAPSRVFTNTVKHLDELKRYSGRAKIGAKVKGADYTSKASKGNVATTFIDKDGNVTTVLNSDASNMSRNIVGMFPDEIDSGTTVADAQARVGDNKHFREAYQQHFPSYYKESIKPLFDGLGLETTAQTNVLKIKDGYKKNDLYKTGNESNVIEMTNIAGEQAGGVGVGQGLILKRMEGDKNNLQMEVMGNDGRLVRGILIPTKVLPDVMQAGANTLSYVSAGGGYTLVPGASWKWDGTNYKVAGSMAQSQAAQNAFSRETVFSPVVDGLSAMREELKATIETPEYQRDYAGQVEMLGLKNRGVEDIYNLNSKLVENLRNEKDLQQAVPSQQMYAVTNMAFEEANQSSWTGWKDLDFTYGDIIEQYNALTDEEKKAQSERGMRRFNTPKTMYDMIPEDYNYVSSSKKSK